VPSAAYVVAGQITIEEYGTGKKLVVGAGEAFAESVGGVHRGYTGVLPAEVVATYSGTPDMPLSVPVH
jgi:hypothetical protein